MGIGGITPLLLNIGISSRSVGSLTLRTLSLSVRAPRNHRGALRPIKAFQGHKMSCLSPNSNFNYPHFLLLLSTSVNVFTARQL